MSSTASTLAQRTEVIYAMTYCERHPNEQAILTCGNCGKKICTICMTLIGEGVRCQDCMARLNAAYEDYLKSDEYLKAEQTSAAKSSIYSPPVTAKTEKPRPSVDANGRIIERDTGFRIYWKHTTPRYFIEPRHYLLAILAALISALIVGVAWGWLIKVPVPLINVRSSLGSSAIANSDAVKQFIVAAVSSAYRDSIHLLPEMLTGVIVAEAIVRVTHDRRGRNLQIIAGIGVFFAYLVVLGTLIVKSYANLGLGFPAFGTLTSDTWLVINDMFKSGLTVFVFWVIGIVIAVVRLKP